MRTNEKPQYEIKKNVKVLNTYPSGWTKEVNVISWNGGEDRYDIRDWSPDKSKMSKGVTLTEAEYKLLMKKGA